MSFALSVLRLLSCRAAPASSVRRSYDDSLLPCREAQFNRPSFLPHPVRFISVRSRLSPSDPVTSYYCLPILSPLINSVHPSFLHSFIPVHHSSRSLLTVCFCLTIPSSLFFPPFSFGSKFHSCLLSAVHLTLLFTYHFTVID